MTDQKAARNDLADARLTIAELREDLNRSQVYMMNKTDEYSESLDRYRDELALSRETIRCLVVAARAMVDEGEKMIGWRQFVNAVGETIRERKRGG